MGTRHGYTIVAAIVFLVAVVAAAVARSGPTVSATMVHGGAGTVKADGRIGSLRLDRSTGVDVQRFAGPADYLRIGAFRSGGVAPRFLALGYQCRQVKYGIPTTMDDGTGTRHPRLSHFGCVTVYFINARTNRLALFTSRSPKFVTSLGTRPGTRWSRVRERGHQFANCGGLFVSRRRSALVLTNIGGREPGGDPPPPISGGRVFDVEVVSGRHPLGLECPEW